ncbi:hypothetical protein KM043_011759 [Ampulex compressa]|nr:hypothetical protein KM043_011759 [Ampulex compressa]
MSQGFPTAAFRESRISRAIRSVRTANTTPEIDRRVAIHALGSTSGGAEGASRFARARKGAKSGRKKPSGVCLHWRAAVDEIKRAFPLHLTKLKGALEKFGAGNSQSR